MDGSLQHYGVKGMKWGKQKSDPKPDPLAGKSFEEIRLWQTYAWLKANGRLNVQVDNANVRNLDESVVKRGEKVVSKMDAKNTSPKASPSQHHDLKEAKMVRDKVRPSKSLANKKLLDTKVYQTSKWLTAHGYESPIDKAVKAVSGYFNIHKKTKPKDAATRLASYGTKKIRSLDKSVIKRGSKAVAKKPPSKKRAAKKKTK